MRAHALTINAQQAGMRARRRFTWFGIADILLCNSASKADRQEKIRFLRLFMASSTGGSC